MWRGKKAKGLWVRKRWIEVKYVIVRVNVR